MLAHIADAKMEKAQLTANGGMDQLEDANRADLKGQSGYQHAKLDTTEMELREAWLAAGGNRLNAQPSSNLDWSAPERTSQPTTLDEWHRPQPPATAAVRPIPSVTADRTKASQLMARGAQWMADLTDEQQQASPNSEQWAHLQAEGKLPQDFFPEISRLPMSGPRREQQAAPVATCVHGRGPGCGDCEMIRSMHEHAGAVSAETKCNCSHAHKSSMAPCMHVPLHAITTVTY